MSEFAEYPKMLYKGQAQHVAHSAEDEAEKVEEGWGTTPPEEAPAAPQAPATEAQPCANCEALKARIVVLENQLAALETDMEAEAGGTPVEALKARIATLEAKKSAEGLARNEHPLLARLKRQLTDLEAEA